jgi:hypothetical protein
MSAATSQSNQPYPRGSGFGSVPVLFALRNVQPKILAGTNSPATSIASAATALADAPSTIAKQTQISSATPSPAIESKAPSASQARSSSSTINRVYNGAIGLLVLALVLLVIRNSQNSGSQSVAKNEPKSTLENMREPLKNIQPSDTSIASTVAKNVASPEQDLIPSDKLLQETSLEQDSVSDEEEFQVGSIELGSPAPEPSSELASVPLPNLLTEEKGMSLTSNSNEESGVQLASKPPIQPMLLDASQGNATSPANDRDVSATGNATGSNIPKAAPTQAPVNNLVDTGVTLPIDLLIELHQKNSGNASSTNSLNNARASTVSYPTYVPEAPMQGYPNMQGNANMPTNPMLTGSASSQLLTGQPYPPISPEYKPVTVPAYERNAEVNNMRGSTEPSTGFVRQPSTRASMHPAGQILSNGSNRYQGAPIQQPDGSTTKQPYMPYVAPTQPLPSNLSGNSTGYPPTSN